MAIVKKHVKAIIQLRRATEPEWIEVNPILRVGEPALSTDVYVVDTVEERIYDVGKDEIPSSLIGETILEVLADTNEMAYVRFASVFKEFKSLDDLERSIAEQRERMKKKAAKE